MRRSVLGKATIWMLGKFWFALFNFVPDFTMGVVMGLVG